MTGMIIPAEIAESVLTQIGLSFFVAIGWIIPAIMAGSKIVGTGISMYANRKNRTPSFEKTAYGKHLKDISQRGVYTPQAKAGILGQVSRQAGGIASRERTSIRGSLERSGMGQNSIAGTRAMSAPGQNMMNILADKTAGIETANEMSKVDAAKEFTMGINRSGEMRRGERKQMYDILAGGASAVGGSIAEMAGSIQEDRAFAKVEPQYNEGMAKMQQFIDDGNLDGANAILQQLMLLLGGA